MSAFKPLKLCIVSKYIYELTSLVSITNICMITGEYNKIP